MSFLFPILSTQEASNYTAIHHSFTNKHFRVPSTHTELFGRDSKINQMCSLRELVIWQKENKNILE